MTLIDSNLFHTVAITLGTLFFGMIITWAIWFAAKMK